MLLSKNSIVVFIVAFFFSQLGAQTIVVEDKPFGVELCDDFPLAMDAGCELLDTVAAGANYSIDPVEFKAFNSGIKDISELKYFDGIDSLYLNNNEIEEFFPLSELPNLVRFHIPNNNLTIAPEINYPNNEKLKWVYVQDNNITSLPNWDQPNTKVAAINISQNELKYIPDFNGYDGLVLLYVYDNYLDFSHLTKLKTHPRYNEDNWSFFPQKPFFVVDDTEVDFEAEFTISVKEKETGNTYFLYQNNNLKESNQSGDFVLSASEDDEGIYKVVVKNDLFIKDSEVLESNEFKISIKYPNQVKEKEVLLFSPNGDGVGDDLFIPGEGECIIYDASGSEIIKGQLPFLWNGQNNSGSSVGPGMYYIKTGEEFLKVLLSF